MGQKQDFQDATNRSLANAQRIMDERLADAKNYLGPVGDISLFALKSGSAIDPFLDYARQIAEFTPQFMQELRGLSGFNRESLPPAFQEIMGQLDTIGKGYGDIVAAGGRTAETGAALSRLGQIVNGQTKEQTTRFDAASSMLQSKGYTEGLKEVRGIARSLTANGGFDAGLSGLLSEGQNILGAGGRTAEINQLSQAGQSLVSSGGMTPELREIMNRVTQGQDQAGFSPEMRQLFQTVTDITGQKGAGGALLPMETVTGFAREAAATAAAQQGEAARRAAISRGGASVFGGTTGQALAEFSDESLRAEGQAVREAAVGQQGLQMQQLQMALQAGTNLTAQANQVINALLGMGTEVAVAASRNIATGGSLMQSAENLVMQRMALGGQFVSQAEQQALQRMATGQEGLLGIEKLAGDFRSQAMQDMAMLTQQQIAGAGAVGDLTQIESQRLLGGLGGQAAITGAQSDLMAQQQGFALQNLGLQGQTFFQGIGAQADMQGQAQTQVKDFLRILQGTGTPYLQLADTALGSQGQALNQSAQTFGQQWLQPGFWSNFGTSFAGGLGQSLGAGLTGGLGGLAAGSRAATPDVAT